MMKIKYFTFQEILEIYPADAPSHPHDSSLASDWFTTLLGDAGLAYQAYGLSASYTANEIKAIVNALMTYVYNRHSDDYLYKVIQPWYAPSYTLQQVDFYKAMNEIINVLNLTIAKYVPMLKAFEKYSLDPTAKITSKSTGRTRFNDTPQEEGEYNDESHATNVSKSISESEVDSGSIMERLENTYKNFKSIILEWSNEFNGEFLKEEQII